MKQTATKYLEIRHAEYAGGYKISLLFNDNVERIVDFDAFLKKSRNPEIAQFRGLKKFKSFQISDGNLMWGDYEMIFPITDLYRGEV